MIDFYNLKYKSEYSHYDANLLTTRSMDYYTRYLLQKAMSVFKWSVPDNWDLNFLLYALYTTGYVAVTDISPYGIIPQLCTISGYNVFYNPSSGIINNPNINRTINVQFGKNGELLCLSPDYSGILDCICEYAEMLSNASAALNTNLYNSRLSYIFYAKTKSQADSYKSMYDKIGTGSPAVFVDAKLGKVDDLGNPVDSHFEPFNANLNANYLGDTLLDDMRKIEHLFAQKIGLPNSNTEKKERMSTQEVDKTDTESVANVTVWYDTIQSSIKRIKDLYPDLTLSCNWRFPPGNGKGETDNEMERNN